VDHIKIETISQTVFPFYCHKGRLHWQTTKAPGQEDQLHT